MNTVKKLILIALTITAVGCAGIKDAMNNSSLTLETEITDNIILEPLAPQDRIAYVRIRDASGNGMRREMQAQIEQGLKEEGIQITKDPKLANLMLHATIMSAGKSTKEDVNQSITSGFQGGAIGASVASLGGASTRDALAVGAIAAAGGFIFDAMVSNDYYTFVLDVEMRERPLDGDKIANSAATNDKNGRSTQRKSSVVRGENYQWIIYKTRLVTIANQINLTLEEAMPMVKTKTTSSLVNLLM